MDHIERHLAEPLRLEDLARVACFSPYHFHRLFSALTGESLYRFILRLRLERAANHLLQNPKDSITTVALDCGFGGSAAFARAFKAAFGVSASAFRWGHRKDRKTNRKGGEDAAVVATHDGPTSERRPTMSPEKTGPENRPIKPAKSTRIEQAEPMTVAYIRHIGPYAGDSALFGRLFGRLCQWAGPRGHLGPGARLMSVYHDNPEITPEDRLRTSVCVVVPPGTRGEGDVGVMEIAGGAYAVASFELDPSEYGAAWNWLMGEWLPSSGYQPDDRPCFESYLNDPNTHPQKLHQVEIWEPVQPL